jgi:TPR repeat protein
MHAIGTMYECGRGTEASTAEAIRWFIRAHAAGDSSALDALQRHRKYLPAFGLAL